MSLLRGLRPPGIQYDNAHQCTRFTGRSLPEAQRSFKLAFGTTHEMAHELAALLGVG
jgi:hypothetical protein